MKNLLLFLRWFIDRAMGTYLSLFVLGLATGGALAANTSYDVSNEPQLYLDASISNSQTTGITIASAQRNGSDHVFTSETGGVLRIRQGSRVEDIYYADATRNTTTNILTLDGVIRNLCTGRNTTFTTCGNGQYFSRGATVELSVDSRLINLKLNRDRVNTLSGSGQITSNQTDRAWIDANSVTTAQRDAFISSAVSNGNIIYNSTLGTMQYRAGGAWISFGSGSTINASTTVRGVVETATGSDLYLFRATDDTGAPLALTTRNLIRTSTGAIHSGRLVLTNANGYIDVRAGGTGTGAVLTGSLLIGRGVNRLHYIDPSANSGRILRSNGASWKPVTLSYQLWDVVTTATSGTGASSVNENRVYRYAIPANTLTAGQVLKIHISGAVSVNSGIATARLRIGGLSGTVLATSFFDGQSGTNGYTMDSVVTIRTTGAGGTVAGDLIPVSEGGTVTTYQATYAGASTSAVSVDTTAIVYLTLTLQFNGSSASNTINVEQGITESVSRS